MRPLAAAVSAAVTSLVVTMFFIGEAESSAPPGGVGSDRLEVYLVEVGPTDVELLAAAGVDTTHLPDLTEGGGSRSWPPRGRRGRCATRVSPFR